MHECYGRLKQIVKGKSPDQRAEAINTFLSEHPDCTAGDYTLQEIAELLGSLVKEYGRSKRMPSRSYVIQNMEEIF